MPRNTDIDSIIQTRRLTTAYRVLTVDLSWPTPYGEPPFASGRVSVPAVGTPPAYDADTFDAAVWTDCTALVAAYQYTQSLEQQCDALTLTVPVAWTSTDLDRAFGAMRAILLQERYAGAGTDTGWLNVAWCLSTGYHQRWDASAGAQVWTVNALDALMLAGLDVIGSEDGHALYQADLVPVGGPLDTEHYDMPLVTDASDAWEFGVTDASGYLHPNWADRPGPAFWCHNVPGETAPIPLAIGGDAVQAVFGEGVVRVSKSWAQTAASGDDYSAGLGFSVGTVPDIRCYLSRFAHPAITDRDGNTVATDLAEDSPNLTQVADPVVAGEVTVDGDFSDRPAGLTLVLLDGTGARYATSTEVGPEYDGVSDTTTFTLNDSAVEVATGAAVRYGEANRAQDIVWRWLIEAGYHADDTDSALYAAPPALPQLQGADLPIILPPLQFNEGDRVTRLQALADLRGQYAVIPSWLTRADADGQIVTGTVQQAFDSESGPNSAVLPLVHLTAAEAEKTDLNVFTRVVARGRARQVTDLADLALYPTLSIDDVAEANGGLPAETGGSIVYGGVTYTGMYSANRSSGTDEDYIFDLDRLLTRGLAPSTNGTLLRPWGWYYEGIGESGHTARNTRLTNLPGAWESRALAEIVLPEAQQLDSVTLDVSNGWSINGADEWASNYHTWHDAGWTEQTVRLDYWDTITSRWLPLTEDLCCDATLPQIVTVDSAAFVTRGPVSTDKLRLVCVRPWTAWGTMPLLAKPGKYFVAIGVWCSQLKLYGSGELRGVAEIGVDSPFTGAGWEAARARFRRRTYVVPEVADWANTQDLADDLALDWLYDVTRNLAPRPISAVRPDARTGDTVRLFLPTGAAVGYPDDQLAGWILHGVTLANSDELVLYWSLTNSGTTRTVNLYSDSARTALVASGSRTGDGALLLTAQNGSRISGAVAVAYTGDDTGAAGAPTYLVTAVDRAGQAAQPEPQKFVLVNYRDPYFEE